MPVDCNVFSQQTVLKLNNDCITLLSQDGWARGSSIDGNHKLLKAILGLVFILYLPFVVADFSLDCWNYCYRDQNTYEKQPNRNPWALKKNSHLMNFQISDQQRRNERRK